MSFRGEFKLKNVGFSDVCSERFCIFQWRSPGLLYITYRIVICVYVLFWLIFTALKSEKSEVVNQEWGAYLTNWTYTLLTVHFTVHALVALCVYLVCNRGAERILHLQRMSRQEHWHLFHEVRMTSDGYVEISGDEEATEMPAIQSTLPWFLKLLWILFSAVSVAALMVTIVFWAILVPGTNFGTVSNINMQLHLVNSILVLLEHAVTAIPVRLLHVIYPLIYGLIYVFFSLFYWLADHSHVMYDILDWGKPWPTLGFILLIGFVIIPVIHLFFYGLFRLKLFIFYRVFHE